MPLEGEYEPSPQGWVRDQVERYEAHRRARGQHAARHRAADRHLLEPRGEERQGAQDRRSCVEDGGVYAMVGSQGGAPTDPAWVANSGRTRQVTVQDGPEPWDGAAREITGEEKAIWWERAVAVPALRRLPEKTDREIPVFLVERRG